MMFPEAASVLILIYRGPWLRRDSRIRPAGRAAGRRAFFDQHRDVLSKNPAKPVDPARSAGRNRRGVLSLGHSFFAQAKKGGSLATASETQDVRKILPTAFKKQKTGPSPSARDDNLHLFIQPAATTASPQ
jgi:hypothetical protein